MKRSKSVLFTAAIAFGLTAMASWSASAGTIFSDNFKTDSSLAQPPWYNISSATANSYALTPGTGLGLSTSTSGKFQEMVAQFAGLPVTLGVGQSLTLTVNFSGTGMWNGSAGDNGGLIFGLYNSGGTAMTADENSTATGGTTATYNGYFGDIGYNTTAGISTKFYSRTGAAGATDELGYYSKMTGATLVQIGTFNNTGNADLADGTAYTLTYTIENAGGGVMDFTAAIANTGGTDNFTFSDTSGLYNSFDTLVFGNYDKTSAVSLNITGISVQAVPEPSMFAFAGLGLAGLLLRFRRR